MAEEIGFDLQQIHKERDPYFRQQMLYAYSYECATCGFNMRHGNISTTLEVAHIKQRQHGNPCEISSDPALCVIHHKAFDRGSIGLDEDMRIQASPAVNGGGIVGKLFQDFDGKPTTLPQGKECYPQEGFVVWYRREVLRG